MHNVVEPPGAEQPVGRVSAVQQLEPLPHEVAPWCTVGCGVPSGIRLQLGKLCRGAGLRGRRRLRPSRPKLTVGELRCLGVAVELCAAAATATGGGGLDGRDAAGGRRRADVISRRQVAKASALRVRRAQTRQLVVERANLEECAGRQVVRVSLRQGSVETVAARRYAHS